jgi:hypothetical protein
MLARLVCQDLLFLAASLHGKGMPGDGIVWLTGCHALPESLCADLIAAGPMSGLAVLGSTTSPQAASALAEHANALLVHQLTDAYTARRLSAVAAPQLPVQAAVPLLPAPDAAPPLPGPVGFEAPAPVSADDLLTLGAGEFLLAVSRPRRLVSRAVTVPARIYPPARDRRQPPQRTWAGA